jgi:hypothetical protein
MPLKTKLDILLVKLAVEKAVYDESFWILNTSNYGLGTEAVIKEAKKKYGIAIQKLVILRKQINQEYDE